MSKNDDLVRTAQTSVRDHIRTIAARLMEGDRRLTIVHPLPSIGTSYYPPDIAKEVGELLSDAIERGAAQGVTVGLQWGKQTPQGNWLASTDRAVIERYCDFPGDIVPVVVETDGAISPALSTPPAPAPDAGEPTTYEEICERCGELTTFSTPTPQPPAVEAEAVERDIFEVANQLEGYVDESTPEPLARFLLREGREAAKLAATLKAKTDEIERLRQQLDEARSLHNHQVRRAQAAEALIDAQQYPDVVRRTANLLYEKDTKIAAAEASNKALREGLKGTLDAWEMLPEGYHRIHAIQSWLADNMQPAIARARSLLGGE